MNKKRAFGDSFFDSLLISKGAEFNDCLHSDGWVWDLENADDQRQPQGDFKRLTKDREPQSGSSGVSERLNGMMTLAGVVVGRQPDP
jgi:hypothetical protein